MPERAATTPDHALSLLLEGNQRWVQGRLARPNADAVRRRELTAGQWPFATVFSCIDSRVPPEIVFDCGIGDLAVVRTGGHVLDGGAVLASLLFAVRELGTRLVLVLGHEACGAVTAAHTALQSGAAPDPGLEPVVESLRPAHEATGSDELQDLIKTHTRLTVNQLAAGLPHTEARIVGGYYSLDTGAVAILD